MAEIDFITAFGRLLCDGSLRDAFAANPAAVAGQIHLRQSDLSAWMELNPAEVELQAEVLLRKRLDLVKYFVPETSRRVGEKLWQEFRRFGRQSWPVKGAEKILDAFNFCRKLLPEAPEALVESEWNRINFAISRHRFAMHWVRMPGSKMKTRRGLQFFLRGRDRQWREFFFYLGL